MAFLLLAVSILYIYNTFKVDIVLWYRSTFHTAQAPDGKCVWWSLGGEPQNCCPPTRVTSLDVLLLLLYGSNPFSWMENLVCCVSAGLHVCQRRDLPVIIRLLRQ